MNLIWNKNIQLFEKRFPQLCELIADHISFFKKFAGTDDEINLYPFWKISESKIHTPIAEENGLRLHSAYNPIRESDSFITSQSDKISEKESIVFLGMGLGYPVISACEKFQKKTIIIIEPDINHFLAALLLMDFEKVFSHTNIIIALSSTPEQTLTLINQYSVENSIFISMNAHQTHNKAYFDTVTELIERNRKKEQINSATLKKFGKLWHKNCSKNITVAKTLNGVITQKNKFKGKPFLLVAAGPSLETLLPYLPELKKRMIIVCVDTALKACLRAKTEPDFIVLTDPQYWAYRHIAGLKSPSSVLVTELAAYPAVFRFECKKILLFNSQVPMAKDYSLEEKGDLGAGGSVASSAFNLCVLCGASEIYAIGLDLSFPFRQTHIKGSTFEENVHTVSSRIKTAETSSMPLLFSGNACLSTDYNNKPVLTDQKMKMFAWWFESRIAELPYIKTLTLAPQGLKIPGIKPSTTDYLMTLIKFR